MILVARRWFAFKAVDLGESQQHYPLHFATDRLPQLDMSSSTAAKESYVDVLIVGAGPAGVMCANALIHAGVNVRIVDQR